MQKVNERPPTPLIVRKLAFFAHDANETVVIKRTKAFQSAGATVIGFMFHRERGEDLPSPAWQNISLGSTIDRNYLARLPKLAIGLWRVLRNRRELRDCDVIYARNFDMMAIATAAKWLTRSSAQLAYEVLDVQRAFVGRGALPSLFRWCERRLLASCDMLVVSSPMFMTRYFVPQQQYAGAWYLLENKVPASLLANIPEVAVQRPAVGRPWIIGWFGRLRCPKSLEILSRLATAHPDKVTVQIRGAPSEEDISKETLTAMTSGRTNFQYGGAYESPRDLRALYSQVHFTWAIDFLDEGSNSDWLLPNRLYEGGLFDAISLARDGTATGDMIARDGLGITLREPIEESLSEWLLSMDAEKFRMLTEAARKAPRSLFVEDNDTIALLGLLAERARCKGATLD